MIGTPFVMVYRVSALTYLLGRPRIKVSHFAMVNLIAGEQVVAELVQHDFTVEKVVTRMNEILPYGPARDKMIEGLAGVKIRLRGSPTGASHPTDRAAGMVLELLHGRLAGRVEAPAG